MVWSDPGISESGAALAADISYQTISDISLSIGSRHHVLLAMSMVWIGLQNVGQTFCSTRLNLEIV